VLSKLHSSVTMLAGNYAVVAFRIRKLFYSHTENIKVILFRAL
jgi:hypothetical protein